MGYFASLYVVEGEADASGVSLRTSVFEAEAGALAYLSWAQGTRTDGLHPYAGGTIFADSELSPLPGYPIAERSGDGAGEDSDHVLLDADFHPRQAGAPVLFHLVLPTRFVPQPNRHPFDQPSEPYSFVHKERLIVTYPTAGASRIRFWLKRLSQDESFQDYDLNRVFNSEAIRPLRFELEFNLGLVKFKIS